jgi:hypothetical protein
MLQHRRVAAFLIALCVAAIVVTVLVRGNYCVVPSAFLQPGEAGTAEMSIYGVALYREVGSDHPAIYRRAVGWYETTLLVEWGMGVAVGAVVYGFLRRRMNQR